MAFPPITTCIVCDGTREETLHKYTLLGFYGVAPHVRIFLRDFSLPFTVCFFFCGTTGEGRFRVELRLTGPSGHVVQGNMVPPIDGVLSRNIQVSYFILTFQGILPGPGEYQVSLVANGVEQYSTSIAIDQAGPEMFTN